MKPLWAKQIDGEGDGGGGGGGGSQGGGEVDKNPMNPTGGGIPGSPRQSPDN